MSLFFWVSRRAGGLSMIVLIALCYWVISQESSVEKHRYKYEQPDSQGSYYSSTSTTGAGIWTYAFAYYCLFIHVLVCLFPMRACWTIWNLTQTLKRAAHSNSLLDLKKLASRRSSYTSVSSSETLTSSHNGGSSSTTSEAGDLDPESYTDGVSTAADNVIHAIVIPNYKEEYDTLKETLEVLASHPRAQDSYDVYLGMEQRESNAETKALGLIQQFAKKFRSIDFTLHPSEIPGEAAGKGSNIGWAARKLSAKYSMGVRKDVIITGIDADSHLAADYFTLLTNLHMSYPETATTTVYAAPIIFDRNAHNVHPLVRVADIVWVAAGMSGLYPSSSIAPPTSVYSLPLDLVDRVGGWDCDGEAIGEDLHMYIKCFFALNGNLTSRIINCPVSQSNVTGAGGPGWRGAYADINARYKQALRHMWGALDTGFAMRKLVEMWQERKHTSRAYQPLHCTHADGADLFIPESQLNDDGADQPTDNGIFSDITKDTIKEPHWEHVFYMVHRIFEAHFLPVHMAILVIASTVYVKVMDGKDDPHNLAWLFNWCNVIRIFGFLQISIYLFMYESFHRVSVAAREKAMVKAGMADGMDFSRRSLGKNWKDYLMVPLVAPLYGTIPSAQALICQLWNQNLVYTVSKKATRRHAPPVVRVDDMA
ncbi:glycosyl transferase family group 2-domain-containing protein [Ilyonectria robusta]|uniref:glycosyl transferase family group 2-domain-containing protein n=1 Tax=Ilyonectria robusta TaxID=1079257 RepID=UPI001E8E94A4|nr:glycosyl transferase family group 2-domain-containing protein [Ilyonectria robusta]KAH8736997.1 glycosyl transferase family group 2-domain-containing protein [Ilyonectria robusta]